MRKSKFGACGFAVSFLFALVIGPIVLGLNETRAESDAQSQTVFNEPPVDISPGVVTRPAKKGVAPLTIKTNAGSDYFVKLVIPNTTKEIMTLYIHGGQPMVIKVPLGSYELKYAAGQVWYGPKYKFGPTTTYAKADEVFPFTSTPTADGITYSGWTVELILQSNGNLKTKTISEAEF